MKRSFAKPFTTLPGPCTVLLIVLSMSAITPAKTRQRTIVSSAATSAYRTTAHAAQDLEQRLRPFLEQRTTTTASAAPAVRNPTDADLRFIAANWSHLSTSFRALYRRAIVLPAGLKTYQSPSGRFDVLYTTAGADAVPSADTYGYKRGSWRTRVGTPNGVPDYVDEVAWSLDSSWSMEIDRFGFAPPLAYRDSRYPSNRYKLVLKELHGDYGLTWPVNIDADKVGYSSFIELENDWAEDHWAEEPTNYRNRPLEAVNITCAHEFFHAVQYSMGQTLSLSGIDDFPLGWLEGAAVLMEELAFGHVDDYVQYTGDFLHNPTTRMLDPERIGISTYKNGLLSLFLYYYAGDTPSIGFIKDVQEGASLYQRSFTESIDAAAKSRQQSWARLLGDFFTQSFFTGRRASAGHFIPDAELLASWSWYHDIPDSTGAVTKTVQPYGMATFSFPRTSLHGDTMQLQFFAREKEHASWNIQAILLGAPSPRVEQIALRQDSWGIVTIEEWHRYSEVLMIVTNADYVNPATALATFSDKKVPPATYVRGLSDPNPGNQDNHTVQAYPNPMSLTHPSAQITFEANDILDVSVYDASGTLIARLRSEEPEAEKIIWDVSSGHERRPRPGTYVAVVKSKDPVTKGTVQRKRKILVIP